MTDGIRGLVIVLVATLSSVGCVAQSNVDRLRQDNDALRASNEQLRSELAQSRSLIDTLRNAPVRQDPELLAELERVRQSREDQRRSFEQTLAELRQRILELSERGSDAVLPRELDEALARLAAAHPDLMTYDARRGMVRFASDLTFALGSIEVRPAAVQSLRQLAQILRGASAADFELRIVGHTDDVPVTNPANRQRFEDNWGLSSFRAISVMRELVRAGVEPTKIAVVGHGEHRPLVPNVRPAPGQRNTGTEANRRVEIYLVRMPPADAPAPAAGNDANPAPAPRNSPPPPPPPANPAEFK